MGVKVAVKSEKDQKLSKWSLKNLEAGLYFIRLRITNRQVSVLEVEKLMIRIVSQRNEL